MKIYLSVCGVLTWSEEDLGQLHLNKKKGSLLCRNQVFGLCGNLCSFSGIITRSYLREIIQRQNSMDTRMLRQPSIFPLPIETLPW